MEKKSKSENLNSKQKEKRKKKPAWETLPLMKTKMTYDQDFKNLLKDYPRQSVRFFAADATKNWPTQLKITPVIQEQQKERLHERFRALDIPILFEFPDGMKKAVLILFEEMTDPYDFSITKFAKYSIDICELLELRSLVPVVVFFKKGEFEKKLELGTEEKTYLSFDFEYCHLSQIDVDSHLNSDNIVAQLNLMNMKFDPSRKLEIFSRSTEGLIRLEKKRDLRVKYSGYIDHSAKLTEEEVKQYNEEYLNKSDQKEEIMGVFEMKKEEGKREGKSEFLMKLLKKRFGNLPQWAEEKLREAKTQKLETWGLNILDAKTLEEALQ